MKRVTKANPTIKNGILALKKILNGSYMVYTLIMLDADFFMCTQILEKSLEGRVGALVVMGTRSM